MHVESTPTNDASIHQEASDVSAETGTEQLEADALISMNVEAPPVIAMPDASTPQEALHADAILVTLEMAVLAEILMNVNH